LHGSGFTTTTGRAVKRIAHDTVFTTVLPEKLPRPPKSETRPYCPPAESAQILTLRLEEQESLVEDFLESSIHGLERSSPPALPQPNGRRNHQTTRNRNLKDNAIGTSKGFLSLERCVVSRVRFSAPHSFLRLKQRLASRIRPALKDATCGIRFRARAKLAGRFTCHTLTVTVVLPIVAKIAICRAVCY
jgi:hypothetical protein